MIGKSESSSSTLPTKALEEMSDNLGDYIDTLGTQIGEIDAEPSMDMMMKLSQQAQQMSILYMTELNIEKTINTCLMNAANDIKFPE